MPNDTPKFTPGPWHKKGKRVIWAKPKRDLPKDNLFNGLVCICATTDDDLPEVIEEACANAQLIACAPDFYQDEEDKIVHLETLRNQVMSLTGRVAPIPMVTPDFVLMYINAIIKCTKELLAKAKGEPQK